MSFFTVVIPYFNRESFLPRTLDSIAAQTFRPVELILVNNTSTDASERICREFAQKYDRPDFHVILASNNTPGAAHARNTGLRLAKGKWISFLIRMTRCRLLFYRKCKRLWNGTGVI